MVKTISWANLREKERAGLEGLVLRGCGGDLDEWVSGINELLYKESIIPTAHSLQEVYTFKRKKIINLVFCFDNTNVDVSRLAAWRVKTYQNFGGMWLSDYVANNK